MVQILLGLLGVLLVYYLFYFIRDLIAERNNWGGGNMVVSGVIGLSRMRWIRWNRRFCADDNAAGDDKAAGQRPCQLPGT